MWECDWTPKNAKSIFKSQTYIVLIPETSFDLYMYII